MFTLADVVLLADVFENFRETYMRHYGLDPAHYYYSAPGLSWDALLKHSKANIESLRDYDIICTCSSRRVCGVASARRASVQQGQQPLCGRLRTGAAGQIHDLIGRKQPLWLGDETVPSHLTLQVGKEVVNGGGNSLLEG